MTAADLTLALRVSQSQLRHFLAGITPSLAANSQPGGGNPVRWIVGHILAERVEAVGLIVLTHAKAGDPLPELRTATPDGSDDSERITSLPRALLDDPSPGTPGGAYQQAGQHMLPDIPDLWMFVTGSTPDAPTGPGFDTLLTLIDPTFDALLAAFQSLDDAALAAAQPGTMLGQPATLAHHLHAYPLHEMYHIGQISLARRAMGPGPSAG